MAAAPIRWQRPRWENDTMRILRKIRKQPDRALRRSTGLAPFSVSHFSFYILHCPRSFTFIEALVSLVITAIVIAGATSALIQFMSDAETSRARLDAVANARAALRDMSFEVKKADFTLFPLLFIGTNHHTAAGNRIDDDHDGLVDEDIPDGRAHDKSITNQHAKIGSKFERPAFVGLPPDLGDQGVGTDPVFDSDSLMFRFVPDTPLIFSPPSPPPPLPPVVQVRYHIGSFDGEDHVLVRDVLALDNGTTVTSATEPLAYNVLDLNFLYWNPNLATPYWVEFWDINALPFPGPGIELPASVYMEVTVYSGLRPLATLGPNDPLEAVSLATVSNIEAVLSDPRYQFVRPPS